jgi:hypothetical protein
MLELGHQVACFRVTTKVCRAPLFLMKTLVISNMQLEVIFRLTTILYEDGKLSRMVV